MHNLAALHVSSRFPIVTSTGWTSCITLPYCQNITYILYQMMYIILKYIWYIIYMFGCLKRQIYGMVTNIHPFPSPPMMHLFWSPKRIERVGVNCWKPWPFQVPYKIWLPSALVVKTYLPKHWSLVVVTSCFFFLKNLRCWEIIPSFPQPKASIPFICLKTHCFESWTVRNELKQFSALVSSMKLLETWNGGQSILVSPWSAITKYILYFLLLVATQRQSADIKTEANANLKKHCSVGTPAVSLPGGTIQVL